MANQILNDFAKHHIISPCMVNTELHTKQVITKQAIFNFIDYDQVCALGESPIYDETLDCLFYMDITAGLIHQYFLESKQSKTYQTQVNTAACLLTNRPNTVLLIASNGVYTFNLESQESKLLSSLPFSSFKTPCRPNECQVLSDGLYISCMGLQAQPGCGALYRLQKQGNDYRLFKILEQISIPNTLVEDQEHVYIHDSLDRTFYQIHKQNLKVTKLTSDLESTSTPDGSCQLNDYSLLTADWSKSLIRHLKLIDTQWITVETISTPQQQPSSVVMAGKQFNKIFITSATQGLNNIQEYDGKTCEIQLNQKSFVGKAAIRFNLD